MLFPLRKCKCSPVGGRTNIYPLALQQPNQAIADAGVIQISRPNQIVSVSGLAPCMGFVVAPAGATIDHSHKRAAGLAQLTGQWSVVAVNQAVESHRPRELAFAGSDVMCSGIDKNLDAVGAASAKKEGGKNMS